MLSDDHLTLERRVIVRIRDGLHARPAAQFVKRARGYAAELWLDHGGKSASAKNAVKLMLLAVKENAEIVLRAEGADAAAALEELTRFLETEDEGTSSPLAPPAAHDTASPGAAGSAAAPLAPAARRGTGASPGVALGPAFRYFPETLEPPHHHVPEAARPAEAARYDAAVARAAASLGQCTALAPESDDAQIGGIAAALVEIVRDADLDAAIRLRIAEGMDAVTAVLDAGGELAATFAGLSDAYMQARAEDVLSVSRAIALACLGRQDPSIATIAEGAIIIADELTAWDLARAPGARIGGIVCTRGAATAHAAIIARTRGIPAVFGIAGLEQVADGTMIGLDGSCGDVVIDPDAATLSALRARARGESAARDALAGFRDVAPRTRAGEAIVIAANLGSVGEIGVARQEGAMGIGLFRTELLFIEARRPLGEDEQVAAYARLATAFPGHHVTIRTLDVGGDKPVPGIDIPAEDNPFLGWRGLRYCLDRPELFAVQLRALLRAAVHGNLRIMLPMVSDPGELRRTRALIETCRAALAAAGIPHAVPPLGIMIETPAAALLADSLAAEVAFFSIGTNDLTQYIMAADRMNPRVSGLNRPDHPAVMRAIEMVAAAGQRAGIPVCMCGEAAARPDLIPRFVQLGLTELSMTPAAVLRAKEVVTLI
ncbi:MAG: phosphoenolpyruvate--protein phosphotransferase [Acidiphilium sp. 20-67-58]|uniref:phosphoenolpyruvate--protein phosphotransferase n=1 Tax=Acidiphilium sp. 20-67-58 TaxID=1970291 RepID=UPI000BD5886D|nr:phosphoenolpyruvate--protein phosphotransferase [Acidiphilium sp. 20-67-58]OYV55041.1 MAG: phosphoenolpyruvate--protein phosphotransferase [Acidiphilium sp. 20-67-58]